VNEIVRPPNVSPEVCATSNSYRPDWVNVEAATTSLIQAETTTLSSAASQAASRAGVGLGGGIGVGVGAGIGVAVGAGRMLKPPVLEKGLAGAGVGSNVETLCVGVGDGIGVAAMSARTVAWTRAVMVASVFGGVVDCSTV
jgi:hypothetical protein